MRLLFGFNSQPCERKLVREFAAVVGGDSVSCLSGSDYKCCYVRENAVCIASRVLFL